MNQENNMENTQVQEESCSQQNQQDSEKNTKETTPEETTASSVPETKTKEKDNGKEKKKDKKNWIILLLLAILILLLLLLMKSCHSDASPVKDLLKVEEGTEWDGNSPQSGKNSEANAESIDIAGYANIYLNEEQKTVNLINPKGNTVYFKYVISDEAGNVLIETDLIAPNQMVEKDLYSLLDKGEHTLSFAISTFDVDTQEPCNGAVTEVKTVIE